jgi:hypothetical protein
MHNGMINREGRFMHTHSKGGFLLGTALAASIGMIGAASAEEVSFG